MEFVSPEGLRLDGRRPRELRRINCQLDVLSNADGSAIFEMGNTKVCVWGGGEGVEFKGGGSPGRGGAGAGAGGRLGWQASCSHHIHGFTHGPVARGSCRIQLCPQVRGTRASYKRSPGHDCVSVSTHCSHTMLPVCA